MCYVTDGIYLLDRKDIDHVVMQNLPSTSSPAKDYDNMVEIICNA